MTANCCEETELKCERYCWTSLFEPMLLSNCTTVERVERWASADEEYARGEEVIDVVLFGSKTLQASMGRNTGCMRPFDI